MPSQYKAETRPIAGTGIGLRHPHLDAVLDSRPAIPWLEILADNHTEMGGMFASRLEQICVDYPITLHCVGMSLGSVEPLDLDYLQTIRLLARRYNASWISDHLCFTHFGGRYYHELLPLPYTEQSLRHLASRIQQVQDVIGQQLLVENVSAYLSYRHSRLEEWEFIAELAERADCLLLLDVNNLYVNAYNLGFNPQDYLAAIPFERVKELHLAGYEQREDHLLDAHNSHVSEAVWQLFTIITTQYPGIPALIEWDNAIPPLQVLLDEAKLAEQYRQLSYTDCKPKSLS